MHERQTSKGRYWKTMTFIAVDAEVIFSASVSRPLINIGFSSQVMFKQ